MDAETLEDVSADLAAKKLKAQRKLLDSHALGTPLVVTGTDPLYAWTPQGYPVPGSNGTATDQKAPKGYQAVKFLPPTRLTRGGATALPVVINVPLDALRRFE